MKFVDVPEQFADIFERAERYVAGYFEDRKFSPEQGEVTIGGVRYLLIRAQALSHHFMQSMTTLYADQGPEVIDVGRAVLYELARNMGRADCEEFRKATGVDDPLGRLSSGPVHFAFTGWGRVVIHPESTPSPDADYLLVYDHPNSFESAAWIAAEDRSDAPVCLMNAGYSAGWCEVAFDLGLVAVEVSCRARGDDKCRFVMAPSERIEERLDELGCSHPGGSTADHLPPFQRLHALTRVVGELESRRVALEQQLSRQDDRIADLFDNASDIIQSVDMAGRFLYVNQRWHDLLGYDDQDLESLNVFDVIHPAHRKPCEMMFGSLSEGERLSNVETVFVAKDGRQVSVEGNVTLRSEGGKAVSTRGIFRDVSEQLAVRSELENLLTRSETVIDNAPVGIILYEATGRCVQANAAAASILGADESALLSQNFRRIASWRESGLLAKAEQALARRQSAEHEGWLETSFGKRLYLKNRFVHLVLAGRPHLLLITEDVTTNMEAELAQLGYQNRLLHVHQISLDIAKSTALDEVLQTAVDGAVGLVMADFGAIVLLDPKTGKPSGIYPSQFPMDRVPPGTEVEGRGILGLVASGQVVHTADVTREEGFGGLPAWHPPVEGVIGVPVSDRGQGVALVLVGRNPGGEPFSDEDRSLVETVASLAGVAMRTARQFDELGQLNVKLATIATTDALMGIGNRRSFDEEVVRFHSGACRYDKPYGVLMVDVDHFKAYNDGYGHPAGDKVLARVAAVFSSAIRAEDRIFRYGGEELVLLLPQQTPQGIAAAAERLRGLVEAEGLEHKGNSPPVVTVSMGGASFDPRDDETRELGWQAVIKEADIALYRAKETGRNRVVVAGS